MYVTAMPDCRIAVTLDGWSATAQAPPKFRVGETVGGTVHVWVDERVVTSAFDVRLEIVPTERGFSVGEGGGVVRLFSGEWQPGEYEYRFELPAPWPPSYRGTCVGWKWMARARADLPWALDATGGSELVVELPERATGVVVSTPPAELDRPTASPRGKTSVVVLGTLFGACLISFATGIALKLLEAVPDDVSGGLAGVGLSLAVMFGIAFVARWLSWRKSEGNPRRAAISLTFAAGEGGYRGGTGANVQCAVKTLPGAARRVEAELVVREFARWTTRNPDYTHVREEVLARMAVELSGDPAIGDWNGALPLPGLDQVPCFSFADAEGRGLAWQVDVHVHGEAEKPATFTRMLRVRPARAGE